MAVKIPDWLLKTGKFLQSGRGEPLNQSVDDLGAMFSRYDRQSPLSTALGPAVERFQQGRAPSPAEPAMLAEGQEPTTIPRLEPMPVGRGTWLNRPESPASLQTFLRKVDEQETSRAREQAKIEALIMANPEIFVGRGPETFINSKEAETYLKSEKDRLQKMRELEERVRHNKAIEAKGKGKKPSPFEGIGKSSAPAAGAPIRPTVTGADVATEFGF